MHLTVLLINTNYFFLSDFFLAEEDAGGAEPDVLLHPDGAGTTEAWQLAILQTTQISAPQQIDRVKRRKSPLLKR